MLLVAAGALTGVPRVGRWDLSPLDAFAGRTAGLLALGLGLGALAAAAVQVMTREGRRFAAGFAPVFLLAVLAYAAAGQTAVRAAGFGYAFWALGFGLLIANTWGAPAWIRPALRSELYIKTGLVLLGAEVLFGNVLRLGAPGLFVAWMVTPTCIVFMYLFGTRVLRMSSRALVIVIAAATSVCGVSAAIAVAAAARARKEELTLAVGMSLIFTVLMMVLMPLGIRAAGMDPVVGAAWIGGTVDATGAVVAAGALLGSQAEQIAAIVKMIQNSLIGLVAFLVAVFWVTRIERDPAAPRPGAGEIWRRFPKFILGFVGASLLFSFVLTPALGGGRVDAILDLTSDLRGWLFCLAFASIGLDSRLGELARRAGGGRPIQLYLTGQTFNLVLTLLAAWLRVRRRAVRPHPDRPRPGPRRSTPGSTPRRSSSASRPRATPPRSSTPSWKTASSPCADTARRTRGGVLAAARERRMIPTGRRGGGGSTPPGTRGRCGCARAACRRRRACRRCG